jgi:Domain of unknown function (DUF222)
MDIRSALEPSVLVLMGRMHTELDESARARRLRLADPGTLAGDEIIDQLVVIERERAQLAAREADLLVALAGVTPQSRRVRLDDPSASAADHDARAVTIVDEVVDLAAAATHCSLWTMRRRVSTARALHARLPRTRRQLARGLLSAEHADVIARVADGLPDDVLGAYESRVVPSASRLTPTQTGTLARRTRARIDRAGEEQRRRQAQRHQDVRFWVEDDGLACMLARLPIADAARLHAALDARAQGARTEADAPIGQRRVAALVEALCSNGGTGAAGDPGRPVGLEVQVTVGLATLAGLADEPALVSGGHGPAESMTAEALRELLADPRVPVSFRRLVTDPVDGSLLDRGRRAYRVPESLRGFLVARDGTCRFPGCSRPAAGCDIDHAEPWQAGGRTDRANLGCLCRRHHVLKTHGSWTLESRAPDGSVRWRGPDGRVYEGATLIVRERLSTSVPLVAEDRPPPREASPARAPARPPRIEARPWPF